MNDLAKIEEIYHQALQTPLAERDDFIRNSCGNNTELHREVNSLLSFDEKAKDFIESPPEDLAAAFITKQTSANLIGQKIGHYQIHQKLGAGGMGEVYLADDTELSRKVALKVLPLQFSQDTERRKRFKKEAYVVSSLNHPNIITIYGIETTADFNFIATELIEGQTLRQLIDKKTFGWQETIEIIVQITNALESAHAVGVIHRDIKPANIMIRQDGIVKVLDFGLAKFSKHGGNSGEFETRDHTLPNAVMGTINYMSPEQALGEKVDFRTDIFSLGVVFYEILSGVKPFDGISDAAIYNAIINHHPQSLSKLNPQIPLALDRIVTRTITKKREDRYQTAAELISDLQKFKENPKSKLLAENFADKHKSKFAKFAVTIIILGLMASGIYFLSLNRLTNHTAPNTNFTYTQLTSQNGEELFPNLSLDGKSFIYSNRESGNWDIYLKQIDGSAEINLTKNSVADDKQAVFSPDGKYIAFRSERDGGGIFIMDSDGENVKKLTNVGFYPNWSPDGKEIVFGIDDFSEPGSRTTIPSQLWRINVETSQKFLITEQDGVQPNWSPNGKRIAFWGGNSGGQRDIWTISVNGGEPLAVTSDAAIDWNPVWSSDGKYLYFVSNRSGSMNLWRVVIDENSGKVLSDPEPITTPSNYSQFFNFARDEKSFVYVQTVNYSNIFKIDFNGQTETVGKTSVEITKGSKVTTNPAISADNQFLIFDAIGDKQEDIFIAKADGSEMKQLTNDVYKDRAPFWSPDGKRIAFFRDETGKYEGYIMNSDGSERKLVTKFPADSWAQLPIWSPDGKRLIFNTRNGYPAIFDPDKDAENQSPQYLPAEDDPKRWFMAYSWSPDGKKIIGYGRNIEKPLPYLMTFDFAANKYELVSDFGTRPVWLSDSRRAIFYSRSKLYLIDTQTKRTKELLSVAPDQIQSISISKDNRSIYFSVQKSESDIWMANTQ